MKVLKHTLLDELTGALVGLARCTYQHVKTEQTDQIIVTGLLATPRATETELSELIRQVKAEKERVAPGCSICLARCGNTDDYDMSRFWSAEEAVRSLKSALLLSIRKMALELYPPSYRGQINEEIMAFFCKVLFIIAEDWTQEELMPTVLELGNIYLLCRKESVTDVD